MSKRFTYRQRVVFHGRRCRVVRSSYRMRGRARLDLIDERTGELVATATHHDPFQPLAGGQVLILENEETSGLLAILEAAHIVRRTRHVVPVSGRIAYLCDLVDVPSWSIPERPALVGAGPLFS